MLGAAGERSGTFMPYWNLATMGLSEMKLKSLRRQVNGSGRMRPRKRTISEHRTAKT